MTETKSIARLLALDSCCVSDALDSLKLPGSISGLRRLSGTQRIAGRAVTVKLEAGLAPAHRPAVHLGAQAINAAHAGDIIVVEHPGIDAGGWGGVLTQAATHQGIAGIVVGGACRDIDEANQLDFAVHATASTTRTARGRLHEVSTGEPIQLLGVSVKPGDYLIADGTGVVAIGQYYIESVLTAAESIAAKEAMMVEALKAGEDVTTVLGADYENMLSRNR